MCYPSVEATVDDASLSKLFLRYNPSLKPSELKYLFSPGESSASKLFTLRTIGGETYGYHLLYMTLREDKKDIPSRKDAVFNLEITGNNWVNYVVTHFSIIIAVITMLCMHCIK